MKYKTQSDYLSWVFHQASDDDSVIVAMAWLNKDGSLYFKSNFYIKTDSGITLCKNTYKRKELDPDFVVKVKKKKINFDTGEILK